LLAGIDSESATPVCAHNGLTRSGIFSIETSHFAQDKRCRRGRQASIFAHSSAFRLMMEAAMGKPAYPVPDASCRLPDGRLARAAIAQWHGVRMRTSHGIVGINEKTIVPIAETGVDVISVGDLTHSVTAVDISLDVQDIKPSAIRTIERLKAAATR
jgi:hypothetical protein